MNSRANQQQKREELWDGDFEAGFLSAITGRAMRIVSAPFNINTATGLLSSAVIGGTVSEIGGGKFSNGATTASFVYLFSGGVSLKKLGKDALDLVGKVWTLPNTAIGLIYGALGHVLSIAFRRNPKISVKNNAIQFERNFLMGGAMTMGNVIVYGKDKWVQPNAIWPGSRFSLGYEEMQHTFQGEILGPFYFPLHILLGTMSVVGTIGNDQSFGER